MAEDDDTKRSEPEVLAPDTPSQLDRIEALLQRILEAVTGRSQQGGLGH